MAVIWCGHCRLPLTPEESAAGTCPVCGGQLGGTAPPPAKRFTTSAAKPPSTSPDSWWPLATLIVLLSAGLVAQAVLSDDPAPIPSGKPAPIAVAKGADVRHQLGARQIMPRELNSSPIEEDRLPIAEPARKLTIKTKEIKPAPLIKFPQIFENGMERTLDLPEGQYRATINNRTRVKLKGVVKTLKIDLVENDSELDATGLEAQEIILGRILGRSRVKLKGAVKTLKVELLENGSELDAFGLEAGEISMGRIVGRSRVKVLATGKVEIRGLIDYQSSVFVNAPKGSVIFSDRMDNAVVVVFAKEVDFRGALGGNQMQVLTTLTQGGKLKFRELTAGARLNYRKANAADPEPIIQAGTVAGKAKFQQIK